MKKNHVKCFIDILALEMDRILIVSENTYDVVSNVTYMIYYSRYVPGYLVFCQKVREIFSIWAYMR